MIYHPILNLNHKNKLLDQSKATKVGRLLWNSAIYKTEYFEYRVNTGSYKPFYFIFYFSPAFNGYLALSAHIFTSCQRKLKRYLDG